MSLENENTEKEFDIDDNSDMIADDTEENQDNETVSFKVSQSATPKRGWSKKDKRAVWIIAVVVTLLLIAVNILLTFFDLPQFAIFSLR